MLKTPFAGLTQLNPEEPLSTDEFSFQAENPSITDRLLEVGAVTHRHDAHEALANPLLAPSAFASVGGGTIPGDLAVEFGYTQIDADGGETAVSPIDSVTTPPQIGAPSGAITATADYTAGQLRAATYYYGRTFIDGGGGETQLGAIRSVDVDPGFPNARVLLSGLSGGMAAVGAAGWKLYRARDGGEFTYLASGTGSTLTDDGTLCVDCTQTPPEFNTTQSFNVIEVDIPIRPSGAVEWKLYGTVQAGIWDLFSLVGSGSGSAAVTVTLTNFVPTRGRPPATSRALRGASKIDVDTELFDWHWLRPVADEAALPAVAASGDARVTIDDGAVYTYSNGTWNKLGGNDPTPTVGTVSTSGSAAVPDGGQLTIPLAVTSGGVVEDVDVSLYLTHARMSDIEVYLASPDGTTVLLTGAQGGAASGYGSASGASARTYFTDEADRAITAGAYPYVGRYRPQEVMSHFRGRRATGTWELRILDTLGGQTGTLQAATVKFSTLRQRDGHTFAVMGTVASGVGNEVPPLFIAINPLGTGQVVKCRHRLGSGSATVKLRKNGVDLAGFTGISVTGASTDTHGVEDVAHDDLIELVVTAVSGSPRDLSFTINLEKTPPP